MERILSVEQMRQADDYTINTLGFSRQELVNRAGAAVAEEIKKRFKGGRVLVCIGKGNNGADGRVVAEILSKTHGFTVASVSVFNGIFKLFDRKFDIIVDCVFGTGLNRPVEGKLLTAINKINESGAYVVSCDIASGLSGDTGLALGAAVKANLTVAIQEYKLGHFLNDGPDYSGEVVVKDIGISIWGDDYVKRFNGADVEKFFPERKRNTNKGDYGKVAIVGGSKTYPGSAILAENALAAFKIGAGYSTLVIPESIFNAVALVHPECTVKVLPCDGNADGLKFDETTFEKLLKCDAVAFGPGAGVTEEVYAALAYLLKNYRGKLIIDADGLNTLAKYGVSALEGHSAEVILTPHVKEFSRLTGKTVTEIAENGLSLARDFAKKYCVTLVLKSAATVITDGEEVYLNTTGTPAMAKAGSGDVLTGIIAGFATKKADALDLAAAACYLFGAAGEIAARKQNENSVTATDVIVEIGEAINSL